jgi:lysophospholipase L1-like esterase
MKKFLFLIVAAFLSLFLAACGGGGGDGSAPALAKTNTPTQPLSCASLLVAGTPLTPKCHVTIYVAGDSTNWGVDVDNTGNQQQAPGVGNGVVGRASPSPVQLLQALADATYGPGVVAFIDGSIPGATLPSDLNGTAPSLAPLATRLAALPVHADIVMTNSQINDQYVLNEFDSNGLATYVANVTQWIGVVKNYNAVAVFMEPNPIANTSGSYPNYSAQIGQTNNMVYNADLTFQNAGGYALGNTYEWENYTTPPNPKPWNIVWLSSDGVHPSQAGYMQKANNYWYGVATANGVTTGLPAIINKVLAGTQS